MATLSKWILSVCVTVTVAYRPYPDPGADIQGRQYCGARPAPRCCPGRNDRCTAVILDTVCYCDMHCNRTVADCCPDFWRLCAGTDPPAGALEFPAKPAPTIKSR